MKPCDADKRSSSTQAVDVQLEFFPICDGRGCNRVPRAVKDQHELSKLVSGRSKRKARLLCFLGALCRVVIGLTRRLLGPRRRVWVELRGHKFRANLFRGEFAGKLSKGV